MYNPRTYLTKELVIEAMRKFTWPASYTVGDVTSVNSIFVHFPKCTLHFQEGFESEMNLQLSDPNDQSGSPWSSFELINYIYDPFHSQDPDFKAPEYIDEFHPFASRQKVTDELHDLCLGANTYFKSCILGDFSFKDDVERLRYVKGQ